jgi:hypothetical protein
VLLNVLAAMVSVHSCVYLYQKVVAAVWLLFTASDYLSTNDSPNQTGKQIDTHFRPSNVLRRLAGDAGAPRLHR